MIVYADADHLGRQRRQMYRPTNYITDQSDSDPVSTWPLKKYAPVLVPTITKSTCMLKHSNFLSLPFLSCMHAGRIFFQRVGKLCLSSKDGLRWGYEGETDDSL